jgi:uncharacterized protein (TIGR02444 family)
MAHDARSAGNALWRFSLAFHARPGVAEALITLQDRDGRDINLILFALWLAVFGRRLDRGVLAVAEAAAAPLRGIVTELRQMRRRLKSASAADMQAMRRRILAAELAGERHAQARIAAAATSAMPAGGDRLAVAEANLALYLGAASASAEAESLRLAIADFIRRR